MKTPTPPLKADPRPDLTPLAFSAAQMDLQEKIDNFIVARQALMEAREAALPEGSIINARVHGPRMIAYKVLGHRSNEPQLVRLRSVETGSQTKLFLDPYYYNYVSYPVEI